MFVVYLFMALMAPNPALAESWRGIMPLRSTRADVERLLGPPSTDRSTTTFYEFERERVSFDYSEEPCGATWGGRWNVPRGTVISIWVTPRPNQLRLSDLRLDVSRFKRERDNELQYIVNYIDEEAGISYQVDTSADNEVTLIKYFPAARDNHRRCPES